jgi:hypothetical protein
VSRFTHQDLLLHVMPVCILQTLATVASLTRGINGTRCPVYNPATTPARVARLAASVDGTGVVPGDIRIITCNAGHFIASTNSGTLFETTAVVTCEVNSAGQGEVRAVQPLSAVRVERCPPIRTDHP